jgi:hypothetical protein
MHKPQRALVVVLGCACLLPLGGRAAAPAGAGAAAASASPAEASAAGRPDGATAGATWDEVERLIRDQKLAQALPRIEALRAAAERRGDDDGWARALVRATEVRIAQGSFAAAVRQLREARSWATPSRPPSGSASSTPASGTGSNIRRI